MIITGMNHFQSVCKKKLVEWYQKNRSDIPIDLSNVFIVWYMQDIYRITSALLRPISVVTESMLSTHYNGDKQELYEDVYGKITNTCHTEE